jgi:alpha-L-rhamnosidase
MRNTENYHTMRLFAARLIAGIGILFCIPAACAAELTSLRCEYLAGPLGIDVQKPRLSWVITSNRRGERQTAYQILVAGSEESLKNDKGDLWDSGKVASDQSIQVAYNGTPLHSKQRCYWKVRFWDENGKSSGWSNPVSWAMGLMSPGDWKAEWITMQTDEGLVYPWFRRVYELKETPRRAMAYVNTPSYYELYINGRKVSDEVLIPAQSHTTKRFFYNAFDVTSLLQPGSNCIALWTGLGWYQPIYGNPYKAPIVRLQLEVENSGGVSIMGTDSNWRAAESCISQIGTWNWNDFGGERWDARRYPENWNQASFDDSEWAKALVIPAPAAKSTWQSMPGSRLRTSVKPKEIFRKNDKWVVDFGSSMTGWMRIRLRGLEKDKEIKFEYADMNDPQNSQFSNNDGFQTFNQKDVYVAGSQTEDIFCSKFNQHAFRYVIISGLEQRPGLDDAVTMRVSTDLEPAGEFSCSNDLFNQILKVTVATYWTQIPHGVLGGGEAREKTGYGDGGTFLTGMLYNMRSDAFFKKWLQDWCDIQREDGFIGHTAPEPRHHGGGPSWGGQPSELVRRLYLYYGDERAVSSAYTNLKKYVGFLENQTKDEILKYFNPFEPGTYFKWYFLGDWNPPMTPEDRDPGTPPEDREFKFETVLEREFFNNCYRVLLWDQLEKYARILGDAEEVKRCHDRLATLRPLVHKTFYDEEKRTYKADRQAYLAIALYSQVVPPELRSEIFDQLENNIVQKKKGHLDTGLQGTFILLDLLTIENRNDLVAMIMNQTTYPSWGFLIKELGVKTWPESWSGWGSQSILVVGSTCGWFYEGLAGIRPDPENPGFRHFVIRPGMVDSVTWVKCSYSSPYGEIVSNWTIEAGRLEMDVEVPVNSTATVYVPASSVKTVSESGRPAIRSKGARFTGMSGGCAAFEVSSGKYRFSSKR